MSNPIAQTTKTIEFTFSKESGFNVRIRATLMNLGEDIRLEVLNVSCFVGEEERSLRVSENGPAGRTVGSIWAGSHYDVEVTNG